MHHAAFTIRIDVSAYFKSSGLYTLGFKVVKVGIERNQLVGQHWKFSQPVLFKTELLQIGKF